jgi:hypothetical protein
VRLAYAGVMHDYTYDTMIDPGLKLLEAHFIIIPGGNGPDTQEVQLVTARYYLKLQCHRLSREEMRWMVSKINQHIGAVQ